MIGAYNKYSVHGPCQLIDDEKAMVVQQDDSDEDGVLKGVDGDGNCRRRRARVADSPFDRTSLATVTSELTSDKTIACTTSTDDTPNVLSTTDHEETSKVIAESPTPSQSVQPPSRPHSPERHASSPRTSLEERSRV